jgi:NADH:ubiquinone oxidoreductase subunit 3 (subunit A)
VLHSISFFSFWVFLCFFLILTIGFIYELNSGSLSL